VVPTSSSAAAANMAHATPQLWTEAAVFVCGSTVQSVLLTNYGRDDEEAERASTHLVAGAYLGGIGGKGHTANDFAIDQAVDTDTDDNDGAIWGD